MGPSVTDRMSGVEIVRAAVATNLPGGWKEGEIETPPGEDVFEALARRGEIIFKYACRILEARPVDEAAFRAVVSEFREGRAPAWLAAMLVRSTRAQDGYQFEKELLVSPGTGSIARGAERTAAAAMVELRGAAARGDLLEVLAKSENPCFYIAKDTCEGAAYGLALLGDPADLAPIVEAVRARRVRERRVGHTLSKLLDEPTLLEWLRSSDALIVRLGIDVVRCLLVFENMHDARITAEVAAATELALLTTTIDASTVEWLRRRLSRVGRELAVVASSR